MNSNMSNLAWINFTLYKLNYVCQILNYIINVNNITGNFVKTLNK